jgi:hypothetical protein
VFSGNFREALGDTNERDEKFDMLREVGGKTGPGLDGELSPEDGDIVPFGDPDCWADWDGDTADLVMEEDPVEEEVPLSRESEGAPPSDAAALEEDWTAVPEYVELDERPDPVPEVLLLPSAEVVDVDVGEGPFWLPDPKDVAAVRLPARPEQPDPEHAMPVARPVGRAILDLEVMTTAQVILSTTVVIVVSFNPATVTLMTPGNAAALVMPAELELDRSDPLSKLFEADADVAGLVELAILEEVGPGPRLTDPVEPTSVEEGEPDLIVTVPVPFCDPNDDDIPELGKRDS